MTKVVKMNKRDKSSNLMVRLLLVTILFLMLILFIVSKVFIVDQIIIEGNALYTDEEIKNILDTHEGQNMIEIFIKSKKMKDEFPYIEDVSYEYISYKTIRINIREKQIMGYILYMGKYFCLDKDGYVVDEINYEQKKAEIPLIQGTKNEQMIVGEKMELPQVILESCLLIHSLEKKYGIHIDIINFNNGYSNDIVLTIGEQTVYFGDIKNINVKMVSVKAIIDTIPLGETGNIYLNADGTRSRYEKNIE